jgi:hypothetical protein
MVFAGEYDADGFFVLLDDGAGFGFGFGFGFVIQAVKPIIFSMYDAIVLSGDCLTIV